MDNKRGMGTGYVTIMLIFALLCLTVFAVLSFQAAYADERLSARAQEYTQQFYAADSRAKEILAQLDGYAAQAAGSPFFAEELALEADGAAAVTPCAEGARAAYSCEINERQSLSVSITFFANPDGARYRIDRWQTTAQGDDEEASLGVWDGSF